MRAYHYLSVKRRRICVVTSSTSSDFNLLLSDMNPLEAVSRFVPTVSWLRYILPDRFQHPMESASAALSSLSGQNQTLALKSYAILQCASARSQTTLTFASLAGSNGTVNVHAVAGSDEEISVDFRSMGCSKQGRQLLPFQMNVLSSALMDHSIGQHICILGPKVHLIILVSNDS